jgi:hypothetical protein
VTDPTFACKTNNAAQAEYDRLAALVSPEAPENLPGGSMSASLRQGSPRSRIFLEHVRLDTDGTCGWIDVQRWSMATAAAGRIPLPLRGKVTRMLRCEISKINHDSNDLKLLAFTYR